MMAQLVMRSAFLHLCLCVAHVSAADTPLEVTKSWDGKLRDAALRDVVQSEFISNAADWKQVWTALRPDAELPSVDFETSLVLVGTAPGPNLVILRPTMDEMGNVRFTVGSTKVGGPGFGYKLVVIPRAGVITVNGQPITGATQESITVEVVGRLHTGVVALGGETTGTTITSNEITLELDFGANAKLKRHATELDGQLVRVSGELERRTGIEVHEHWIVKVSRLSATNKK